MGIDRLVRIVRRLRSRNGCPWDRRQTHRSLKPNLLEETYEVLDAIDRDSPAALKEELGDLLMQVVFHAVLAEERGRFRLADAIRHVCDKLVHRHPHVFARGRKTRLRRASNGNGRERGRQMSAAGALRQWETLKRSEKPRRSGMDGVPAALPALLRATRVQSKAARLGCAPAGTASVRRRLKRALRRFPGAGRPASRHLGEALFSLVLLARGRKLDAEGALQAEADRFIRKFRSLERRTTRTGRKPTGKELEKLWES